MGFEPLEQQLKPPFQNEMAQITGQVFRFQLISSSTEMAVLTSRYSSRFHVCMLSCNVLVYTQVIYRICMILA